MLLEIHVFNLSNGLCGCALLEHSPLEGAELRTTAKKTKDQHCFLSQPKTVALPTQHHTSTRT